MRTELRGEVADGASPYPKHGPERRQLTVMFCDIVDSSLLAQRIDPEDLRDVITDYRETCSPIIERFNGFVARFMEDGILALFGYPAAYEDTAGHAIRAGLEVIAAIRELSEAAYGLEDWTLRVRIGVATGLVIAGDRIGEGPSSEESVVGEAPNLAARLQQLAAPDALVISNRTHALVRDHFECRDSASGP